MASKKQVQANQQNALKSTGPKSLEGKHKVSVNRITHGILSDKLLLADENPQDYQSLLDDLQAQLSPVGALELSVVEKIAVILWRQRRLVSAETATIELGVNPNRIANEVTSALGLSGFGIDKIEPDDLLPPSKEQSDQIDWCKAVIDQYSEADSLTMDNLNEAAPLIYAHLAQDAEADEETILEYLAHTSLDEYAQELIEWCYSEVQRLETMKARQPVVAVLSQQAKDKLAIPWQKLDVLSKYQATLDNQLYKAMKALRDTQESRLKNIVLDGDSVPTASGDAQVA